MMMMMMKTSCSLAAVVAFASLLGTAVAQDNSSNCTDTITEVACETEGFSTLCAALEATGLDDDLSTDQWTVFAPNDSAFNALGEDNLEALFNDTVLLTDLLLFHVIPQVVMSKDLPCAVGTNLIEMANEQNLRSLCVSGTPTYLKGAFNPRDEAMPSLVQTGIETCSGIIHAIDGVLLSAPLPFPTNAIDTEPEAEPTVAPTAVSTMAPTIETTTTSPVASNNSSIPDIDDGDCLTISEIACTLEDFTTLCDLLDTQNLTNVLDEGLWTVFAPTDVALEGLDGDSDDVLDILLFHVIPDVAIASDNFICTQLYKMANMADSRHVCEKDADGGTVVFQKGSGNPRDAMPQIVQADVAACGGSVVHVVNQIMLP